MLRLVRWALVASLLLPFSAFGQSADLILEKKTFSMPSYTTVAGATIKDVKIGWEAAGTLNADKSNAILVEHFFTATSHAFGKYSKDDKAAGYWDYLIGPGKIIDTNKYYVLSSDTLVNLNVNAPNVVTTGPASINPDTAKPYGMSFPVVSIKDFVRVQKALIDSLGIKKLHAVIGASMGALQTYEWAASYPDSVERIVPVIGAPGGDAFLIAWLDIWAAPIRIDPHWNGGDYYGKTPPTEGLKAAIKAIVVHANHWEWATKTFGLAPADPAKDPAQAMDNKFKIQATLDTIAAARASTSDANSLLYLVKANQLANVDPGKIKARTLVLYTSTDLIFYAPYIEEAAAKIAAGGTPVDTAQLKGPNGHLNGVFALAPAGDKIRAFLEH
jgi:homoserine O-acetyltransferase